MINIEQNRGNLKISYINEDGQVAITNIVVPKKEKFQWIYSHGTSKRVNPDFVSWDEKEVSKQPTNYLDKYRMTEFIEGLPASTKKKIFSNNTPRKYYIDIETEILDEFPNPENPKSAILSIAIADDKNKIVVLSTSKISKSQSVSIGKRINEHFAKYKTKFIFKHVYFKTEYDLLYTFFKMSKDWPLITGWNFVDFDWAYLVGRGSKLNVDASMASPTGTMYLASQPSGNSKKRYPFPNHKIVVDYMEVYRKWDRKISPKESDSLDYVSQKALGLKKITYTGNLNDLYRDDRETYLFYNAVDSLLVRYIDEELGSLNAYLTLAYLTKVEPYKAFSSIAMIENILGSMLLKNNKLLIKQESKDRERYQGAFVFPAIPGRHEDLITLDYASLYPTIIRQHNISPEVFLGKVSIVPKKMDKNTIYCASGATFKKGVPGVLPALLTDLYSQRKSSKKIYGDIEAEINELKKILNKK